jgi:hypothetical protein
LQDQITINFQRGIDNFSVKLFNGLTTTANYLIRDDTGDSVTVTLGPNSSSNDAKIVQLLDTHGAKSVTIISLSSGPWDFSIDNIGFNFSTAETKIGENPVVASIADSTKDDFLLFSYLAEKATSKSASDLLAALQTVGLVDNDLLQLILSDPFDPNYKQEYTPKFVQLPTIQPDSTVTQQTANDANAAMSDFSKEIAFLQAVYVTLNRLSSATQAGDQASVALQNADLDTFLSLSCSALAAAGKDFNALANDMMGMSLPSVTTQDINNFLNNVKLHGFSGLPQQEQALFNQFGLSSTDQQNVVNELLSVNPSNVPLNLAFALQQAATAFQGLASVYGGTSPVADTTIPAVAVEGSMYNAVGSAAEIAKLATLFLPAQVANAIQNGFNPQVYASEALGLAFAFGNENGGTAFATNFGPSNTAMPNTTAGDAAFAAAASHTIFGTASTSNLINAIDGYVTNWKAFYTSNGIPGISHATAAQIDLAARGAAWGDAVGVEVANNLGPLIGQVTNFLADMANGTAIYSASLSSQPHAAAAQAAASASPAETASQVQLTGVASHIDHIVM